MVDNRCKKWVQNCRRADLTKKTTEYLYKNCVLCANHFEDGQFMNSTSKNKLVWNGIPTLFDVPNPPPTVSAKRPAPRVRSVAYASSVKKQKLTQKPDSSKSLGKNYLDSAKK